MSYSTEHKEAVQSIAQLCETDIQVLHANRVKVSTASKFVGNSKGVDPIEYLRDSKIVETFYVRVCVPVHNHLGGGFEFFKRGLRDFYTVNEIVESDYTNEGKHYYINLTEI